MSLRTTHGARCAAAALACAALTALCAARAQASEEANVERAVLSFDAMQQAFYLPQQHLYRGETGASSGPYSYFFPFTQALAATNALGGVPRLAAEDRGDIPEHLLGLRWYWNPKSKPPGYEGGVLVEGGAEKFYDDNEWAGLQLIRSYRMTGEAALLVKAEETFNLVTYGWDRSSSHPCPGGVWWTQREGSFTRNTVSNAPGAELGLELYQLTRRSTYLQWARRMYHWVRVCLRQQVGLYADSITLSGYVDPTYWIYNQGTMVGTEVLLYEVTRVRSYLEGALESAAATIAYFTPARLAHQPPFFVAIFAENLLRLNAVAPNPAYAAYLEEFANHAWLTNRNPATGLFEFHESQANALLNQAAMIQIYSYLTWEAAEFTAPPPAPAPPPPPPKPKQKRARRSPHKPARAPARAPAAKPRPRHPEPTGGSRAP